MIPEIPSPPLGGSSSTCTYEKNGADGFSWMSHVDRAIIATHLCEVWQGSTVVQVEMAAFIGDGHFKMDFICTVKSYIPLLISTLH